MNANQSPLRLLVWMLCFASAASAWAQDTAGQPKQNAVRSGVAKLSPAMVHFETEDKVTVAGRLLLPPAGDGPWPGVVLLPMLGHTKETFGDLMVELAVAGWASLAVDLRGHGESVKQGIRTLDAERFRPGPDFINMRLDAMAAIRYAAGHEKILADRIAVGGAGIGANVAVQAIQQLRRSSSPERANVAAVVLLSPGESYRGVQCKAADLVDLEKTPLFLCASHDDRYSFSAVESYGPLFKYNPNMSTYFLKDAGHGTAMLAGDRQLIPAIVDWLEKKARGKKGSVN